MVRAAKNVLFVFSRFYRDDAATYENAFFRASRRRGLRRDTVNRKLRQIGQGPPTPPTHICNARVRVFLRVCVCVTVYTSADTTNPIVFIHFSVMSKT